MMNAQTFSTRTTSGKATRIAAASLLALAAVGTAAGATFAKGAPGAIWTTDAPCAAPAPQNDNHYAIGETVYIHGEKFAADGTVDWTISGLLGGASGDPGATVASGSAPVGADGSFCIAAYEVAGDDWGEYSVVASQGQAAKHDNYRVDAPVVTDTDEDPTQDVDDETDTNEPPADTTDLVDTTDPDQQVLDETDGPVVAPSIDLPPTDTVSDVVTSGSALLAVLGLGGLAGLAVLFAPSRRRDPDATE